MLFPFGLRLRHRPHFSSPAELPNPYSHSNWYRIWGQANLAAVRAIRDCFRTIDCKGLVRIGEGRKDNAPGIFAGDRLGTWQSGSLPVAIALDPIDGTTLTAKGLLGAISVLAAAICENPDDDPSELFPAITSHYMEKIAVGPAVAASKARIDLDAPLESTLQIIADQLGKRVCDLVAVVLDRPRHDRFIASLRKAGCGIRLITDGDVAAAIAPCLPNSGVHLYIGIGGSPEVVISAAAIKCLGGEQLCRMWTNNQDERSRLQSEQGCSNEDLMRIWSVDEMAQGEDIIFAATGISDSPMLQGIRYNGQHFVTHSILVGARNRTMRLVETYHDIHRRSILEGPVRRHAMSCGESLFAR